MDKEHIKKFLKAAAVRSLKTIAQTASGNLVGATIFSEINWKVLVSTSLLAGLASLLTSVATGLPEAN
jgi:hypothetical protein